MEDGTFSLCTLFKYNSGHYRGMASIWLGFYTVPCFLVLSHNNQAGRLREQGLDYY